MNKIIAFRRDGIGRPRPLARPVVALLALSVGAAGWQRAASPARADERRPPTLKEIGDGIKAQWDRIESLKVEYESRLEAVAPHDAIKRYSLLGSLSGMKEVFAFKGDKRYYRYVQPPGVKVLAPDVDPEYDVIPGGKELKKQLDAQNAALRLPKKLDASHYEQGPFATDARPFEVGFDGKEMHQRTPYGNALIANVNTMGKSSRNFTQTYLSNLDRVLPDPVGSPEDAERHCFPEVPLPAGAEVRPTPEVVDGAPCVVVEVRGERIWFDPAVNFGVRRHEVLAPGTEVVAERRTNTDFAEVAGGIWLPKKCYLEVCGPPLAPPAYRGKPLYRTALLVSRISVNDVPDSLFVVNIPPGDDVFDASRATRKDEAHQLVAYKMPADASQIDETVRKTLADEAERLANDRRRQYFIYTAMGLNLAVVAVFGIIFGLRKKPGK